MLLVVAVISLLVVVFGWKKLKQMEQEDAAAQQAFESRKPEVAPPKIKPVVEPPAAESEDEDDHNEIAKPAEETPLESLARLKIALAAGDRDEMPGEEGDPPGLEATGFDQHVAERAQRENHGDQPPVEPLRLEPRP